MRVFCYLLMIFANSLAPVQARENVGPELDQSCLTLLCYSWKSEEYFEKSNVEKYLWMTKNHEKFIAYSV